MHGVDPTFKFDLNKSKKEGIEFFEMNSDNFFKEISDENSYDLIFIDGLHTYDQTYRDFCNCLSYSHSKSIFVIDDVVPCDSYAGMRNQNFAVNQRINQTNPTPDGSVNIAWMGDVYRILFLIKIFNSNFEYATLCDGGNPQIVLWKESSLNNKKYMEKKPFEKCFNYPFFLQAIENLNNINFDWVMNYCPEIYQFVREEDIFDYLKKIFK